jgi:UPF0755 protein
VADTEMRPTGDAGAPDDDWADDVDGDYVYVPEDRGVGRKLVAVLLAVVLLVGAVVGYGWLWLDARLNPATDTSSALTFVVPKDAGLNSVARTLEEQGIVADATVFRYYAKYKNLDGIQAGTYDGLHRNESMDRVIERFEQGPIPPKFSEIAFPEGLWESEVAARILQRYPTMSSEELALSASQIRSAFQPECPVGAPAGTPGCGLEGYLFPATYRVEESDEDNEQKLLTQMVQKFDQVATAAGLGDSTARTQPYTGGVALDPYQVLIVASMIEAETKVAEDRPKVARVIYNRLAEGMKLEIDATVLRALGERKTEITRSDLEVDSPYNTRKFPGLPPTPINSPGQASIEAALSPSTEPGSEAWLYYVLIEPDGRHFFTGNYNEFLRKQQEARAKGLL